MQKWILKNTLSEYTIRKKKCFIKWIAVRWKLIYFSWFGDFFGGFFSAFFFFKERSFFFYKKMNQFGIWNGKLLPYGILV